MKKNHLNPSLSSKKLSNTIKFEEELSPVFPIVGFTTIKIIKLITPRINKEKSKDIEPNNSIQYEFRISKRLFNSFLPIGSDDSSI